MADTAAFEDFVTTRSAYLLRTAYALTRDHTNAEDLLQTALARSWPAWGRIANDPEPYVRQVMVNTYRSWWRRKWNGERPTDEVPEVPVATPQSSVDDRDEVWRALSRLPKKQQAVLVLRYFEDLSEAQIAEALDMAPGTVKSYASRGLATLRLDPALRELPALEVPEPPHGTERVAAVKERITARKRNRVISMAAAFAGVLGVLIGFSLSPLHTAQPATTPGGFPEYTKGYHIVASSQVAFASTGVTFAWTPSTWDVAIFTMCTHDVRDVMVSIKAVINGRVISDYGCMDGRPMTPEISTMASETTLRQAGVVLGQPVDVKIVVDEPVKISGPDLEWESVGSIPAEGRAAIGIGEQMAFSNYPLPRRPRQLIALEPYSTTGTTASVGRKSTVIPLTGGQRYVVKARSQTPGVMEFYTGGKLRHELIWWDYSASELTLEIDWLEPGGSVDLTISTRSMTGEALIMIGR